MLDYHNLLEQWKAVVYLVEGGGGEGRAPAATWGGAEIDLVFKKSDQPIGTSWTERS